MGQHPSLSAKPSQQQSVQQLEERDVNLYAYAYVMTFQHRKQSAAEGYPVLMPTHGEKIDKRGLLIGRLHFRGLGKALFPAHAVARGERNLNTLIINQDHCPGFGAESRFNRIYATVWCHVDSCNAL